MMTDENRDSLIAAINEYTESCIEYEESHKDAGGNYAHMPAECWSLEHDSRLAQFIKAENIDMRGFDIDHVAGLALDNFKMEPGNIFSCDEPGRLTLESFPIGEIEVQLEYSTIADSADCDFNESILREIIADCDCYIRHGDSGTFFAYAQTDCVWLATITATALQAAIDADSDC